jgi:fucose 4-O-acetylase-like acetyltransferase
MRKQRLLQFDLLKGIGILSVMCLHVALPPLIGTVINMFVMPLFFFISGCFYKMIGTKNLITKKARQLLIPWIFFASISFVIDIVINFDSSHSVLILIHKSVAVIIDGLCGDENSSILFRTIWFLPVLFAVTILYNEISAFLKKRCAITFICFVLYVGGGISLVINTIGVIL